MRYAIYTTAAVDPYPANAVVSVILLDDQEGYTPPEGMAIRPDDGTPVWSAPQAVTVPAQVTMFQARAVLLSQPGSAPGTTKLDDVNAAIASAGPEAALAWEYSNSVTRDGLLVAQFAQGLGISDADLDALFIAAAQIEA